MGTDKEALSISEGTNPADCDFDSSRGENGQISHSLSPQPKSIRELLLTSFEDPDPNLAQENVHRDPHLCEEAGGGDFDELDEAEGLFEYGEDQNCNDGKSKSRNDTISKVNAELESELDDFEYADRKQSGKSTPSTNKSMKEMQRRWRVSKGLQALRKAVNGHGDNSAMLEDAVAFIKDLQEKASNLETIIFLQQARKGGTESVRVPLPPRPQFINPESTDKSTSYSGTPSSEPHSRTGPYSRKRCVSEPKTVMEQLTNRLKQGRFNLTPASGLRTSDARDNSIFRAALSCTTEQEYSSQQVRKSSESAFWNKSAPKDAQEEDDRLLTLNSLVSMAERGLERKVGSANVSPEPQCPKPGRQGSASAALVITSLAEALPSWSGANRFEGVVAREEHSHERVSDSSSVSASSSGTVNLGTLEYLGAKLGMRNPTVVTKSNLQSDRSGAGRFEEPPYVSSNRAKPSALESAEGGWSAASLMSRLERTPKSSPVSADPDNPSIGPVEQSVRDSKGAPFPTENELSKFFNCGHFEEIPSSIPDKSEESAVCDYERRKHELNFMYGEGGEEENEDEEGEQE